DQIASARRTDEKEARYARLVCRAQDWTGISSLAAVLHADRLEKLSRRVGAQFEKDQLRRYARGFAANDEIGVAVVHLLDAGAEVNRQLSSRLARQHLFRQHLVGAGDLRSANHQANAILIRESDGDLHRGVAGSDHQQILIAMIGRIDQTVPDVRQLLPW